MGKREDFEKEIDGHLHETKKYLMKFFNKEEKYAVSMAFWFSEVAIKNKLIFFSRKKELINRRRSGVYFVDFGVNVGSEFNYPHFCVVVAESKFTATVIPISSKKDGDDEGWKSAEDHCYVDIGTISGFPGEARECYAVVSQITTVSKQRLSDYRESGRFYKLSLSDDQMDLIDAEVIKYFTKVNKGQ